MHGQKNIKLAVRGSNPRMSKNEFLLQNAQTGHVTNPASNSMDIELHSSVPGGKTAGV